MAITIPIPSISANFSVKEIRLLFRIYFETLTRVKGQTEICFDFSECNFFSNHSCVFLGGLDLFVKATYDVKKINYTNISSSAVADYFQRLGYFDPQKSWTNLPYSDFSMEDIKRKKPYKDINQLLNQDVFPFKSETAKSIIKGTMGELFLNVYQHSESPAGATSSAQFYRQLGLLRFSIVDFGLGICQRIRHYMETNKGIKISSQEAILKAFEYGFTTKDNASGTGLKAIKELVCDNDSKISIFCNNIFYQYDGRYDKEYGYTLKSSVEFSGTFIAMDFNTNKICY